MQFRGHLIAYFIVWSVFLVTDYLTVTIDWFFYASAIFAFFIINPDIDQLILGTKGHRWFVTHSVLFSILIHRSFSPYISTDLRLAKEFAIILFLPILVHLVCDFQITDLFRKKSKGGTWTISLFPVNIRLGRWGSVFWMFLNVGGIIYYAIALYGIEVFTFFLG